MINDLISRLDSALYKLFVTRIVPGGIAISGYATALLQDSSTLRDNWATFRTEWLLLLLLAASTIGLLIEDLGTYIENGYFRMRAVSYKAKETEDGKPRDIHDEWYRYLRMKPDGEIGHRYLSEQVLLLRFEIHTAIALVVSLPSAFLALPRGELRCLLLFILSAVALFLVGTARSSVDNLIDLRLELLKLDASESNVPLEEAGK